MILEQIKELLVEQLNLEYGDLEADTRFDDIGADPIDVVELVMALEAELGVQLPDEELERVATLGDLAQLAEEV
ncbi:MAG: acyl carrier protein [Clostridia bacterium]|nr:acyl carrier protein [Clostridia bacterium]MBQ6000720.1 acyl carrier protein [Clostridia bacterium]MBQ6059106.1 acyl carrier protein [Clostridia bacterium]